MKLNQTVRVLLPLLFLLNACTFLQPDSPRSKYTGPGGQLFTNAERSFQHKSYDRALPLYNQYLSSYSTQPAAPLALMRKGEIYRTWKDYIKARNAYRQVITQYGRSKYTGQAMSWILQTLYDEGSYREVLRIAKGFLDKASSKADAAGMHLIVGDTYLALNSPVNAVYFYAKANEQAAFSKENYVIPRLNTAVEKLSSPDILALLERITDETTRGFLMYRMGAIALAEARYGDGKRTLSQFVTTMPNHMKAPEARQMLEEMGYQPSENEIVPGRIIGCLLPLTGSYQVYGNRALRGVELAIAKAGKGIHLIVKDSGSQEGQAGMAVEELAREGSLAIIGPIITARSAAETAEYLGVPIIALTQKEGIPEIGSYVFRNFLTPRMQARTLAAYAVERLGLSQFSVLYPDEKYGTTFLNLFREEIVMRGGNLVGAEPYDTKQTDFKMPIRKLRGQGRFEALFIPDAPQKTGLIIPQLAYYGVNGVQLLGTNLWHSEKLIRMAGKYANGALFPDVFFDGANTPEVKAFVSDFRENFGEKPGFIEALAYDTTRMLIRQVRQPKNQAADDVREALSRMSLHRGVTGVTSFIESGEVHKKLYMIKIDKNNFAEAGPGNFSR